MNKLNLRTFEDLQFDTYSNLQKEQIKRLNNLIEQLEYCLYDYESLRYRKQKQEIKRLNNIIKEAKEYIESRARKAGVELMPREIELLEILNKGE